MFLDGVFSISSPTNSPRAISTLRILHGARSSDACGSYPVFVHRLAPLIHASFRPRLATAAALACGSLTSIPIRLGGSLDSLLALDPIPILLEPLVEQVYALSATNHPDPQFSPTQLVPLVVDAQVLDPGAGTNVCIGAEFQLWLGKRREFHAAVSSATSATSSTSSSHGSASSASRASNSTRARKRSRKFDANAQANSVSPAHRSGS